MSNFDFNVDMVLGEYARENGYQLGGWHPNSEGGVTGHFHYLTKGYSGPLVTDYIDFDDTGNKIEGDPS